MFILELDAGHGGSDPGAVALDCTEKHDVLSFTLNVGAKLAAKYVVDVRYTRTTDATVELKARTDKSNADGANFFISFHENAFNGSARGYESYAYTGAAASTKAKQTIIHNKVMAVYSGYGVPNRGLKEANLYVLHYTNCSALLFETLFIDQSTDNALQHDPAMIELVSNAYVAGIAEALNLPLKPVQVAAPKPAVVAAPAGTIYRVQVGAFESKDSADKVANELIAKGYKAIVK